MGKEKKSSEQTIAELKAELDALHMENDSLVKSLSEFQQMTAELKETEQTLRLSQEKFRLLFENAPDEVLLLDKFGMVIDVNESVENLFGFSRNEVVGRNIFEFAVFNQFVPFRSPMSIRHYFFPIHGHLNLAIFYFYNAGIPFTGRMNRFWICRNHII